MLSDSADKAGDYQFTHYIHTSEVVTLVVTQGLKKIITINGKF